VIGARAALESVGELAAQGPEDLSAEAEAAQAALLRAFSARDVEAIRAATRRAGNLIDQAAHAARTPRGGP
jgi:hypothetical protein